MYPIVSVVYEIVCSKYPSPDVAQAVTAFLQAAIGPGQVDLAQNEATSRCRPTSTQESLAPSTPLAPERQKTRGSRYRRC